MAKKSEKSSAAAEAEAAQAPDAEAEATPEATIPDPAQMSVQDIKEVAGSGELSAEQLEALKAAEEEKKGRKQAIGAIDSAIEQAHVASAFNDGQSYLARGLYTEAQASFEEAHKQYESAGDKVGIARSKEQLAILHLSQGRHEDARTRYQEVLGLYTEQGDQASVADVQRQLALIRRLSGDRD